jgi:hypothetical protein
MHLIQMLNGFKGNYHVSAVIRDVSKFFGVALSEGKIPRGEMLGCIFRRRTFDIKIAHTPGAGFSEQSASRATPTSDVDDVGAVDEGGGIPVALDVLKLNIRAEVSIYRKPLTRHFHTALLFATRLQPTTKGIISFQAGHILLLLCRRCINAQ